jgi:hypothetical protein
MIANGSSMAVSSGRNRQPDSPALEAGNVIHSGVGGL